MLKCRSFSGFVDLWDWKTLLNFVSLRHLRGLSRAFRAGTKGSFEKFGPKIIL